ncbi:MAG TPA: S8 family peptidase [Propionicimonas sp.]|jgi:hypothetical protein
MELRTDLTGITPEEMLVLEVAGSVADFTRALSRLPGLEWLGAFDDDALPDDDFFVEGDRDHEVGEQVFLVMSNQQGLDQLLHFWESFTRDHDASLPKGLGPLKQVFKQLRRIRRWGPEDRVRDTGLDLDLERRTGAGQTVAYVELELWFRASSADRRGATERVRRETEELLGTVLRAVEIPAIGYHALLARLPLEAVQQLVQAGPSGLIEANQIMRIRPVGQVAVEVVAHDPEPITAPVAERPRPQPPRVALLDGMPLQRHEWLDGRLVVDDPEDWEGTYPAEQRRHGTAMASLILHGELDSPGAPLGAPLYVRPVMRPVDYGFAGYEEGIPEDELPVDLVHRAVARMFERTPEADPVAPSVQLINMSLGDPSRPFDRSMSAWARVLDHLSWRYQVLFMVSSGNVLDPLILDVPRADFESLRADPQRLQQAVLRSLTGATIARRLLSPAEAVNVLTVGASHDDNCAAGPAGHLVDPYVDRGLPSPVSRQGPGFRRATKPDVLFPGGRKIYRERLGNAHAEVILDKAPQSRGPGHRVAAPGRGGELDRDDYTCGTSNAAALATRAASQVLDMLDGMRDGGTAVGMERRHQTVLVKALLAHGARWTGEQRTREALGDDVWREAMARLAGYGTVDVGQTLRSSDERVTILGWGDLSPGLANRFELPLPASFGGVSVTRRVTVTLAWLTPVSARHQGYRSAALWFEPYGEATSDGNLAEQLRIQRRVGRDWQRPRRGTLQHEVFEGTGRIALGTDDKAYVQVNCRPVAEDLAIALPYGLAVTLEASPAMPIFNELAARIRPPVRVRLAGI